MQDQHIDIITPNGTMNTFITCPEENGPFPIVLFLMDAPGKREELHDMARRLATTGYYVMLPNLYYRRTAEFTIEASDESRETMYGHMNSLSNQMVVDDCKALLNYGDNQEETHSGPAGVIGYCMSGPFAFAAANKLPDRIKAAASFHGIRLFADTPDSPHLEAEKMSGELYIACAETDDWAPVEMINNLDQHLKCTGINYRIEWYPGSEHGFVFPNRGPKYHKASAERHWERVHALLGRNLK
ncbi:MAG: carboxymethylenebutenolidase [Flavobacterium sp.]|jgi:carboxymethylenebutenolidase